MRSYDVIPTAPVKTTFPVPAVNVKVPPTTVKVSLKVILPPPAPVSIPTAPFSVVAVPANNILPAAVVMLVLSITVPPVIVTVPVELNAMASSTLIVVPVIATSPVVPVIPPVIVVVADDITVKVYVDIPTAPVSATPPVPAVNEIESPRVTTPWKLILSSEVVMSADVVTVPAASCVKAPSSVMLAAATMVSSPELVTSTVPEFVVVTVLLNVTSVAVILIPSSSTATVLPKVRVAADSTTKPLNTVPEPTVLTKETAPVPAAKVSLNSPLTFSVNVIVPTPAPVLRSASPVSVTTVAKLTASFVVVISPAVDTTPAPSCKKNPPSVMSPPAPMVRVPELVIVTVPLVPVFTVPLIVMAVPLRSRPSAASVPSVITAPVNVVVPVPAVCVMLWEVNAASAVTFPALTISTSPSAALPPTIPSKSIWPLPAVRVSVSALAPVPSTVSSNFIVPTPIPVLMLISAVVAKVTGPSKEILLPAVSMSASSVMSLVPLLSVIEASLLPVIFPLTAIAPFDGDRIVVGS